MKNKQCIHLTCSSFASAPSLSTLTTERLSRLPNMFVTAMGLITI